MWGIHRWPVNSPHKGQWRGTLKFSFICAWINGRVNNGEAGDLRRHRAHYDVIVMICSKWSHCQYLITGSDNGLVPTRHQAISWISLDQVPWRQITPMSQYIKIAPYRKFLELDDNIRCHSDTISIMATLLSVLLTVGNMDISVDSVVTWLTMRGQRSISQWYVIITSKTCCQLPTVKPLCRSIAFMLLKKLAIDWFDESFSHWRLRPINHVNSRSGVERPQIH